MAPFSGKRILLTGASSGIGRALAVELAKQGAALVITARDPARLERVRAECAAAGARAVHVIIAELSQPAECGRVVKATVEALGGLDLLLNNAGALVWGPFREVRDPACFAQLMAVNYGSVAYLTHAALPHLVASRGQLAAVSSLVGMIGAPNQSVYSPTKHALHGFLDSLRIELRGTGVDVTLLSPDFVATDIFNSAMTAEGQQVGKQFAPGRYLTAEKCARIFVRGLARRRRLVMTSWRGRLALFARLVAPWLVDLVTARAIDELKLVSPPEEPDAR